MIAQIKHSHTKCIVYTETAALKSGPIFISLVAAIKYTITNTFAYTFTGKLSLINSARHKQ